MAPRLCPFRPALWWAGLCLLAPALANESETSAGALAKQPLPWAGVQSGAAPAALRLSARPAPADDSSLVPLPWVVPHWVAQRVAFGSHENSVQLHC